MLTMANNGREKNAHYVFIDISHIVNVFPLLLFAKKKKP